jgi:hypothetical protein
MRGFVCAIGVAIALAAHSVLAQADPAASKAFWKSVQTACDATAAKPASELGQRIARAAINEFELSGGHQIDANGELLRFGSTAAASEDEKSGARATSLDQLGWRRVMTYWRALYRDDVAAMLEVRAHRDTSDSTKGSQAAALLRATPAELLPAIDGVSDPGLREILREAIVRAAVIDTPWSAAFISYVIRKSGVAANAFQSSNAHRTYIYDAFATSAAELAGGAGERLYRACPLTATRPREGDLICNHRESALADASEEAVRERIRAELGGSTDARSVRRTHCEVVAFIDAQASKMYTVGGNVHQGIVARKLNLRQADLKYSAAQTGHCRGPGHWALPVSSKPQTPDIADQCSLTGYKWFVLLQLR